MKYALLIAGLLVSTSVFADKYVRGYVKSDGTYVQPHFRSEANSNRYDNYSSQGNSNLYTGERGSQRNEFSTIPQYNNTYGNPYSTPSISYDYYRR